MYYIQNINKQKINFGAINSSCFIIKLFIIHINSYLYHYVVYLSQVCFLDNAEYKI